MVFRESIFEEWGRILVKKQYNILLVNPFSSAKYLSDELAGFAINATALYTIDLAKVPSYLIPNKNLFDEQIFFCSCDSAEIIKYLGNKSFEYVINGFENSIELAEILAKHYTPKYTNTEESCRIRQDKYRVHQILVEHGVNDIKQVLYVMDGNIPDISKFGFEYPCFIKPLAAGASIGACKISDKVALEKYFYDSGGWSNVYETEYSKNKFLIEEFVSNIIKNILVLSRFAVTQNQWLMKL